MRSGLLALALMVATATTAQASHIFFDTPAVNGQNLDSAAGPVPRTFTLAPDELFTVSYNISSGDTFQIDFNQTGGTLASPANFLGGVGAGSQSITRSFSTPGTWQGTIFFNTQSSFPDYVSNAGTGAQVDGFTSATVTINVVNPVPEPTSLALFGLGLTAAALRRRRHAARTAAS